MSQANGYFTSQTDKHLAEESQLNSLSNLIKESTNITKMKVKGREKEFVVIKNSELTSIFGPVSESRIRVYLNRLGYPAKSSCEGWCFERHRSQNENPIYTSTTSTDEDLEKEIHELEEMSLHNMSNKDLCRLLNLRKIYNIRRGDTESLLLDNFAEKYTKVCRISKYEEIRLGFKLMEASGEII